MRQVKDMSSWVGLTSQPDDLVGDPPCDLLYVSIAQSDFMNSLNL